jgi:ATP-dependent Lhr-like helicase
MSSDVARLIPDALPVFFRRRRPWPMQEAVISELVRGREALVCAPTASGKTEAAIAGLYQRHVSFGRPALSTVWVAPTKALVNDIYARLSDYVYERSPGSIRRYTGDRHEVGNIKGAFLLVATPEALDSLQLMQPDVLAKVRAAVIDEAHLLHGTARGQQLRHVIERLRVRSAKPSDERDTFQRVAMTATLRHADAVRDAWLGEGAKVLQFAGTREISFELLKPQHTSDRPQAEREAEAIVDWLSKTETRKVLIFGNSRNRTHILALALHRRLSRSRWPLYLHIGILSREEREKVESAMKEKAYGVCVATSTLEVGIDIGDIDAILLADVPPTVNSFLQRIGRGNRRSDTCRVVGLDSDAGNAEVYEALLACARTGELDDWHDYDRASVRFQQVLSLAWRAARSGSQFTEKSLARMSGDRGHQTIVLDMSSTGCLRNLDGVLVPADALMDEGDARRVHSVIATGVGTRVVNVKTGEEIASAGDTLERGKVIFAGTGVHEVLGRESGGVYVSRTDGAKGAAAVLPSSRGGIRGLPRNLVWAIARSRGRDPQCWIRNQGKLLTWGGTVFNMLIAAVAEENKIGATIAFDDYGLDLDLALTPRRVEQLIKETRARNGISLATARKFHQPTRYFRRLSNELQAAEVRASVPYESALRWLAECSEAALQTERVS